MIGNASLYHDFLAAIDVDALRLWAAIQTASGEVKPSSSLFAPPLGEYIFYACSGTFVEPDKLLSIGACDEINKESGTYGCMVERSQAVVDAEEFAFVVKMSVLEREPIAVRNHRIAS